MQPQYIKITIYDQSTKKARLLSIPNNLKLSQLRELIEKQWQVKQFKFINQGTVCSKATEKHTPVAMYMKAYNLISIVSQVRQEPKKQSKIIQKQSKRLAQSSIAQRHIANTREFLQKQRINQEREKLYEQKMTIFNNINAGNLISISNSSYIENTQASNTSIVSNSNTNANNISSISNGHANTNQLSLWQQLDPTNIKPMPTYHFKWTRENIQYCQLKYGIDLSQTGQGLDLDNRTIKMEDFVKCDWRNVEWLAMYSCGIDDHSWRVLVDNTQAFPQLKILALKDNQITTILEGDLEHFKSLRLVQFGTQDGCNPLTTQSLQVLKRFKQKNKHIRVKFRY